MAINFAPEPLATPRNRRDIDLGQISGFRPVEPTIVVNPADPANIAVSSHNGVRLSTDAGGNFTGVFNFTNPPGTNRVGGDTDLIFDSQGRLFWSNLAGIGTRGVSANEINPITGANISTANIRSNGDDKEFITADQTLTSPFQDNLYMVWTGNFGISITEVYFSRSTNQGVTWSAPIQLSDNAGGEGFPWPSDVGVAPNGDVYVAYHAGGSSGTVGNIWVLRSTDGGQTFPQKNQAFLPGQADITFNVQTGRRTIPQTQFWMQGAAQPWVLADPARPGNIYIITSDDPDNLHGTAADDVDIAIARSTNNGQNWTRTTLPVNPPGGSHQFFPTAAIDEFGNIVVAWYDNRNGQTNGNGNWLLDVFATYSTDGGITWATPFQLNDNPFDPDIGAVNRFAGPPPTTRIGEYFGIDIFGGTAYVAWTDSNRATGRQTVRYDTFAIAGSLTVSGDDGGVTNDTIEIRDITTNTDFIEVVVNARRQYAGLGEALSGGIAINGLGGNDVISVEGLGSLLDTNLLIDGGLGDDTVNFQTNPTNIGAGDISVITEILNLNTDIATNGGEISLFANEINFGGIGTTQKISLTGDVKFNTAATINFDLNGTDQDTSYDQLEIIGKINLNNSTLALDLGFSPTGGDRFTIIENDRTDDAIAGTFDGLAEEDLITVNDSIFSISYIGGDGNDVVSTFLSDDIDKNIKGSPNSNLLIGTNKNDLIQGLDGNDVIVARKGNDVLLGGHDNDKMFGGKGDDVLLGGNGNDKMFGGKGDDLLNGGSGDDYLIGGKGIDTYVFTGKFGHDTILFHEGFDQLDISAFVDNFGVLDTNSDGKINELDTTASFLLGRLTLDLTFDGTTFGSVGLIGVDTLTAADFTALRS